MNTTVLEHTQRIFMCYNTTQFCILKINLIISKLYWIQLRSSTATCNKRLNSNKMVHFLFTVIINENDSTATYSTMLGKSRYHIKNYLGHHWQASWLAL